MALSTDAIAVGHCYILRDRSGRRILATTCSFDHCFGEKPRKQERRPASSIIFLPSCEGAEIIAGVATGIPAAAAADDDAERR
jgi:hypothetical protein